MKKSSAIKHQERNLFLVFFTIFIPLYLITALIVWASVNFQLYHNIHSATQSFIKSDSNALYNSVFITAFDQGKTCLSLTTESNKKICYEKTSRTIADALHEDKFLTYDQDLMFIKPDGGKLYSLGWSGEVKDITNTSNFKLHAFHTPQVLSFLARQCHYFNVYDGSQWGCEVYIPLNYSAGTLGYVVRLAPLEEDTWLPLIILYPLLFLSALPDPTAFVSPVFLVTLGMIGVPGLLAIWATKRYKK